MDKREIERACMRTMSSVSGNHDREVALYALASHFQQEGMKKPTTVFVLAEDQLFKQFDRRIRHEYQVMATATPNNIQQSFNLRRLTNVQGMRDITVIVLGFPWQRMHHHELEDFISAAWASNFDIWNIQDF